MVADIGNGAIPCPIVSVALNYDKLTDVQGISLSTPERTVGTQSPIGFQWANPVDFLPYSKVKTTFVYIVDVDAKEASPVADFEMVFHVSGANLTAHLVPAFFHIVGK